MGIGDTSAEVGEVIVTLNFADWASGKVHGGEKKIN